MKILVITGIFPPDIGGPASYVPNTAEEIVKHGHIVTTITLSDVPSYTDNYNFDVVRIQRKSFKPIRLLKTILAIARYGRQADLLFVNGLALEAAIANYFLKKPIVQKVVGDFAWERARNRGWTDSNIDEFQKNKHSLKVEFLKRLRNFWIRKSYLVIVPSRYLKNIVKGWGVEEVKIEVIYNAVEELSIGKTADLPEFKGYTIVSVGRLVPWKGFDNLIQVVNGIPHIRLIIIGSGPEEEKLKNLAHQLGLDSQVIFTGGVNREEVISYLKSSDLFIFNSTYEGLPHIILEVMQIGVPVIATKVGGTTEIVENAVSGLLLEPNNNEQLKEAIELLIKAEELRNKLVRNAKEQVKKFSFEKMEEKTLKVFSEVISEFYSPSPT